jgi:hypothetical protein
MAKTTEELTTDADPASTDTVVGTKGGTAKGGTATRKITWAAGVLAALTAYFGAGGLAGLLALSAAVTDVSDVPHVDAPIGLDRGTFASTSGAISLDASTHTRWVGTAATTGATDFTLTNMADRMSGSITVENGGADALTLAITGYAVSLSSGDLVTTAGTINYIAYECDTVAGDPVCSVAMSPTEAAGGSDTTSQDNLRTIRVQADVGATTVATSGRAYASYLGYFATAKTWTHVRLNVQTGGSSTQVAEVALATTPTAPVYDTGQTFTFVASSGSLDDLTGTGIKGNTASLAYTNTAGVHMWQVVRTAMAGSQPTFNTNTNSLATSDTTLMVSADDAIGALPSSGTYSFVTLASRSLNRIPYMFASASN